MLPEDMLPENAFSGTYEAWQRGAESLRRELGIERVEVLLGPGPSNTPGVVIRIAHGNALQCLRLVGVFHTLPGCIDKLLRDRMVPAAERVKALAVETKGHEQIMGKNNASNVS